MADKKPLYRITAESSEQFIEIENMIKTLPWEVLYDIQSAYFDGCVIAKIDGHNKNSLYLPNCRKITKENNIWICAVEPSNSSKPPDTVIIITDIPENISVSFIKND